MDEKTAKGPSSQMPAPAIQSGIDQKLQSLARPAHSGVSAPAERLIDIEVEVGGQRPADAKAGGLRSGKLRSEGQRDQVRSPN